MNSSPLPPSIISAISVLDSLVRAGMRHVVVAPGSRSAPLTYALAALEQAQAITSHVRIDERSAGFTALGLAKELKSPVGIVTTSGTAVGELTPAVMEAYHSGIPLIVLSADRPERLRGTGANQTTHQPGMFSNFVRAQVDLIDYSPETTGEQAQAFSTALEVAFERETGDWGKLSHRASGPVHLNIAFDTPLTPQPEVASLLNEWAQSLAELPAPQKPRVAVSGYVQWQQSLNSELSTTEYACSRAVVIAGDGAGPLAQEFAERQHLPLFAEPSAGIGVSQNAVLAYRDLASSELWESIEKVVLFGHPTLSRPISALLENTSVQRALFVVKEPSWFTPGRRGEKLFSNIGELAEFAGVGNGSGSDQHSSWLESWISAGARRHQELMEQVQQWRETGQNTGRAAGMSLALQAWQDAAARQEILVCGSSNLIRDLEIIASWNQCAPVVYASRGLAGIDGTLATACGISLATAQRGKETAQPVRMICGDLTFIHDISSLNIGPLELKPKVTVEVLDDCGGGIFGTLEHGKLGQDEHFSQAVNRYFTTPHDLDLQKIAESFGQNHGISVSVHTPQNNAT
ncbi:MAG: 2-succinyl-5-enolpyruvyl-6-hydroxy-3-cyclohexene-1-carboxylic-acid synthase [Rothia sp. (in: high G+C Gram-positive bacteria)]|nr:2-succinyl-5-enolpyruvyl-6-hydroxy-3-cyclohexene-1-carboxylic-acid synthase [Rothia sp. (in: high G+C Gram-positive bacteria)]